MCACSFSEDDPASRPPHGTARRPRAQTITPAASEPTADPGADSRGWGRSGGPPSCAPPPSTFLTQFAEDTERAHLRGPSGEFVGPDFQLSHFEIVPAPAAKGSPAVPARSAPQPLPACAAHSGPLGNSPTSPGAFAGGQRDPRARPAERLLGTGVGSGELPRKPSVGQLWQRQRPGNASLFTAGHWAPSTARPHSRGNQRSEAFASADTLSRELAEQTAEHLRREAASHAHAARLEQQLAELQGRHQALLGLNARGERLHDPASARDLHVRAEALRETVRCPPLHASVS